MTGREGQAYAEEVAETATEVGVVEVAEVVTFLVVEVVTEVEE